MCSQSRYTKEKTFAIIDEKLKSIREKFQKDQQMDMAEFYDLFTRSNELIHVVDCRSQEEFDECHISGAYTLTITATRSGEDCPFAPSSTRALESVPRLPSRKR
ncbi:hypothetical protein WA556_002438 [Blastocystis sp. ATCC 50177/Nand II]